MRVGIVVYGPLDRRSGGYLYDRELADRLEAADDEVVTVSLPERPYPARLLDNATSDHVRRIERADLDVLLEDELCHPSLALTNRRLDVDCPIVSVVHHLSSAEPRTPWRNRVVEAIEREFLRSVDAHVCTSRSTRSSVAALVEGRRVGERWLDRLRRSGGGTGGTAVAREPAGAAGLPGPDSGPGPGAEPAADESAGRTGAVDAGDGSATAVGAPRPGARQDPDPARPAGRADGAGEVDRVDGQPALVAYPAGDRFGEPLQPAAVRARAREGPLRVLFVGNVTSRKRVRTLVEGLARVNDDWHLTVVGDTGVDPEYVDRVRDVIDALGVDDRVEFAGRLDDDALADAFARHHVLAGPSEYEGFGIVYVEAMGFGLPAIASSRGGAPEVVRPRENGRLVDPGDASAITDVVAPLCRDRDRLADLGVAALDTYRAHPTWDETATRVREFLLDLVERDTDRG